ERIIKPFGDFVADRSNIRHRASEDAWINPASPHKRLHQPAVLALTSIERSMKTHYAASAHLCPGREKDVGSQSNGQSAYIKLFKLNDGIKLGDEESFIDHGKNCAAGAHPVKRGRSSGHINDDSLEYAGSTQQRVPIRRHRVKELRPLHCVCKLRIAVWIGSDSKIGRVQHRRQPWRYV